MPLVRKAFYERTNFEIFCGVKLPASFINLFQLEYSMYNCNLVALHLALMGRLVAKKSVDIFRYKCVNCINFCTVLIDAVFNCYMVQHYAIMCGVCYCMYVQSSIHSTCTSWGSIRGCYTWVIFPFTNWSEEWKCTSSTKRNPIIELCFPLFCFVQEVFIATNVLLYISDNKLLSARIGSHWSCQATGLTRITVLQRDRLLKKEIINWAWLTSIFNE